MRGAVDHERAQRVEEDDGNTGRGARFQSVFDSITASGYVATSAADSIPTARPKKTRPSR